VVGHARRASAEDGRALAEMLVDDITAVVRKALAEDWPVPPGPR
jgi:creatinine amidohydrolase/Fe(II)-dependent formamide hydrolase-like protein